MKKILCPYCFERFGREEIEFRCVGFDDKLCTPQPDEPQRKYFSQVTPPVMKPTFRPEGWAARLVPLTMLCPSCKTRTTARLCPHCHNKLPEGYGRRPGRILALIGAKNAGKTIYIGALLHSLKNGALSQKFGTSLRALDEHSIARHNEILKYLYTLGLVPPATTVGSTRSPMVFDLRRERRLPRSLRPFSWVINRFYGPPAVTFVFFDTAGESLDDIEITSVEARYISRSDGLIFLLDPLQIQSVTARLSDERRANLPAANTEPSAIIDRVVRLFNETRQLSRGKVGTTVAVTLSKIDEVRDIFEPGSPVTYASRHNGYFDAADAARMHESIHAHVRELIGNDVPNKLQNNFHSYNYFAVSSLGSTPEDGRLSKGVASFRVEDPLLYILAKWGFVPRKEPPTP